MKLLSLAALTLIALSTNAQAHSFNSRGHLAGVFSSTKDCSFQAPFFGEVHIPAGLMVITENQTVPGSGFMQNQAVVLQAGADLHPALTMVVGEGAPFQYGSRTTSMGSYDTQDIGFTVNSKVEKAENVFEDGMIQITVDPVQAMLIYTSNAGQSFCEFTPVKN